MQAIQSLKTKYYFYSTWRRFRQLWNAYRAVAGGNDLEATESKLNQFLDEFKENYQQLVQEGYLDPNTLDRIFGDMGDVLVELLESLFDTQSTQGGMGAASVVDKVLSVSELILHDEKYRALVQHSPHLLRQLVSLLDTLKGTDNRRSVLRLIASIGTRLEAQLEIGKLEGFKKIALLLLEGDAALSGEIYNTLQTLINTLTAHPPPLIQGEVSKLMKIAEQRTSQANDKDAVEVKKGGGSSSTGKLSSVLSSLGAVLAQFTSKARSEVEREEIPVLTKEETIALEEDLLANSLIPSKDSLLSAIFAFEEREKFLAKDFAQPSIAVDEQRAQIHDLMRAQGTLASITASLSTHEHLLETLCKLLLASPRNQLEFQQLHGYDALQQLFESRAALVSESEDDAFTTRAMRLLCALILDVRGEGLVGNVAALRSLIAISASPRVCLQVQLGALAVLHVLLSMNPLNVAAIMQLGPDGFPRLLLALKNSSEERLVCCLQAFLIIAAVLQASHSVSVLQEALDLALEFRSENLLQLSACILRELGCRKVSMPLLCAGLEALTVPLIKLSEATPATPPLLILATGSLGVLLGVAARQGVTHQPALMALSSLGSHANEDVASAALLALSMVSVQLSVAHRRLHEIFANLPQLIGEIEAPLIRVPLCAALAHAARLLVVAHSRNGPVKGAEAWILRTIQALLSAMQSSDILVRESAWCALGSAFPLLDELRTSSNNPPLLLTRDVLVNSGVVSDVRSLSPLLYVLCAGLKESFPSSQSSSGKELALLPPPLLQILHSITSPRPLLLGMPIVVEQCGESFLFTEAHLAAFREILVLKSTSGTPPHSPQPLLSRAAHLSLRALGKVRVRSKEAVILVHAAAESLPLPVKRDLVTLLSQLCRASDASLQRVRRGTSLDDLVRRFARTRDEAYRNALYSLCTEVARYDITSEELLHLISQSADVSIDSTLRARILHLIANCAQRMTPAAHWSFSGSSGYFRIAYVDKFPWPGVGYTFSCWMQLLNEEGDGSSVAAEQGLVAWTEQHSDAALWELYFKRAGPRQRVLCLQTRRGASPAETITLDRVALAVDDTASSWHLLTMTQRKEELTVYLDGAIVQKVSRVPDPRSLLDALDGRPTALAGYVGRRARSTTISYLRARLGPLYWLNGVWPPESVRKAFRAGPLNTALEPTELRPFLVVHPQSYALMDEGGYVLEDSTLTGSIQDVDTAFAGVVAHNTRPLRALAVENKEIVLSSMLSLLDRSALSEDSDVLSATLRALVHVLLDSQALQQTFESLEGFSRLRRSLERSLLFLGAVSGSLDPLLEWACVRANVVQDLETARPNVIVIFRMPLQILIDLLISAAQRAPGLSLAEQIQVNDLLKRYVLLLSLVVGLNARDNASLFLSSSALHVTAQSMPAPPQSTSLPQAAPPNFSTSLSGGLELSRTLFSDILELILRLTAAKVSWRPLERVIQSLLPHLDLNGVRTLSAFLLSSPLDIGLTELDLERAKATILNVMLREMSLQAVVVARLQLLSIESSPFLPFDDVCAAPLHLALSLLQSALEEVRILALKILALLLQDPTYSAYFERHFGFHVVALRLVPFTLSAELAHTLLGVALDHYRCSEPAFENSDVVPVEAVPSASDVENISGVPLIVRPEAVHALLTLLPHARDERLSTAVLVEVSERLLRDELNLERMWSRCGNGEWLLGLLEHRNRSDELARLVAALVRRFILFEITRKSPSVRLSALLNSWHEAGQAYAIEILSRYFRDQPQLNASSAQHVLAHLALLWRLSLSLPCTPNVSVAVLDAIGALLVHNSAPVRLLIHKSGLIALRADIIAHLLQMQRIDSATTRYFVMHFDIQSLAHHDDFKACQGLLRLLLALHESSSVDADSAAAYRTRLLIVLRVACSHVEEHALSIRDLFAEFARDEVDVLLSRFLSAPAAEFLNEYFAKEREPLRARICAALLQRLQSYDTRFKSTIVRLQSEQQGRRERARSIANRASSERWAACAAVEQRCRRLAAASVQAIRTVIILSQQSREADYI